MLDGGLPLTNMHFGSFDWDTLSPSFVENAVHGFLALLPSCFYARIQTAVPFRITSVPLSSPGA